MEKFNTWLQLAANIGIIGGLVLVGFQIYQNNEITRLQMIAASSQRAVDIELTMIGERGAAVWRKVIEDPYELTFDELKIADSIIWANYENWENTYRLYLNGLMGEEWRDRVSGEAAYWLDHPVGRGWWATWNPPGRDYGVNGDFRAFVDAQVANSTESHSAYFQRMLQNIQETQPREILSSEEQN